LLNKKAFILLLIFCVSFFIIPNNINPVNAHNPTWWDYEWNRRLEITINHTLIDENLIDFPILIYVNSSLVNWDNIQNNLDDIRFIGNELEVLSFEIDSYILNDEAWFWVKFPEVYNDRDTYFFMYYDNKFCLGGEDSINVWDSNFVMVQHMNDETTSTVLDSTDNNNDGTKTGGNSPLEVSGFISNAQDFDGDDDKIVVTDSASISPTDQISIGFWVSFDVIEHVGLIWKDSYNFILRYENTKYVLVVYDAVTSSITSYTTTPTTGTSYYIVCTLEADGKSRLYINGNLKSVAGTAVSGIRDIAGDLQIGYRGDGGGEAYLDGILDEIQVSNIGRSPAWISASYYSELLELVIYGLHEHPEDFTLREDINNNTLLILIVFIVACSGFTIMITQKRRK